MHLLRLMMTTMVTSTVDMSDPNAVVLEPGAGTRGDGSSGWEGRTLFLRVGSLNWGWEEKRGESRGPAHQLLVCYHFAFPTVVLLSPLVYSHLVWVFVPRHPYVQVLGPPPAGVVAGALLGGRGEEKSV